MKTFFLIVAVLSFQLVTAQSTEISGSYDKIGKFVNGVAFVHKNGLVGLINTQGKEVIKPEYEKIDYFGKDNVAYTWKNGLVGLIDINGKVIIDNIYEQIGHFKGNQAIVKKDGLSGVVDKSGKILVDVKYNKLSCEANGVIKAVNPDGTEVLVIPNK